MFSLPALVPPEEQRIDNDHWFYLSTALVAFVVLIAVYAWRQSGGDECTATEAGLEITSRRHGDRVLTWDDVIELGCVRHHVLAGRTVAGEAVGSPGPLIAGWLCRPAGMVPLGARRNLQALAERHGVPWRAYAPAEVGAGWD